MKTAQVHIDLDRVLEVMGQGVRRASAFMAVGIRASRDEAIDNANLEEEFQLKFLPQSMPKEAIAKIREEFGSWVVGSALRDLDQFCSVFLDRVHAVLVNAARNGQEIGQEALDAIGDFEDTTSVALKLDAIAAFGVKITFRDDLASLSKARNALTHNLGTVGSRHLNADGVLKLSWRGLDMHIGDKVIQGKIKEPIFVERGGKIGVAVEPRERTFPLGAAIQLSEHDLSEVCWTYWTQAAEIIRGTTDALRKFGIDIRPPYSKRLLRSRQP